MSIEILLTDVTEMHGEAYCLAGWDVSHRRMVRPVLAEGRWSAGLVRDRGIAQGRRLRFTPAARSAHASLPHAREDTSVLPDDIATLPGPRPAWQGEGAPEVADNVMRAFDGLVLHAFVKQGTRRCAHVPEGSPTRSLAALRLPWSAVDVFEVTHRNGDKRLRAILDDGDARYDLPVVSRALRTAYRDGGIAAVREILPVRGAMHVRLGLSRGCSEHPGKCFVMLNGILW